MGIKAKKLSVAKRHGLIEAVDGLPHDGAIALLSVAKRHGLIEAKSIKSL